MSNPLIVPASSRHLTAEHVDGEKHGLAFAKQFFLSDGSVPWMGSAQFLRLCDSWGEEARWDAQYLLGLAAAIRATGVILRDWNPRDTEDEYLFDEPLLDALSQFPLWLPREFVECWTQDGFKSYLSPEHHADYVQLLKSPFHFAAFMAFHENYPIVREVWSGYFHARKIQEISEIVLLSADKMDEAAASPAFSKPFNQSALFINCHFIAQRIGASPEDAYALALLLLVWDQPSVFNRFELPMECAKIHKNDELHYLLRFIEIGFKLEIGRIKKLFDSTHPFVNAGFLFSFNTKVARPRYHDSLVDLLKEHIQAQSCKILCQDYPESSALLAQFASLLPPPHAGLSFQSFSHVGGALEPAATALKRGRAKILLWGPPGSGKTQLALLLCQSAGLSAAGSLPLGAQGTILSNTTVKSGVERLSRMRNAEAFIRATGNAAVIADECEDILCLEEAKSFIALALDEAKLPQIWIANDLNGAHPAYLRRFDFVLHIPSMPLWAREKLAEALFSDKQLATRVAQTLHTPAQIRSAYDWCQSCGSFSWPLIALKAAGDQKAFQASSSPEEGSFVIDIVPPDPDPDKGLAAIAGFPELVEQARRIAHIFEKPASYHRVGAKVPKGILLSGPPGSGKTLFARALANEVGVPVALAKTSELAEKPERIGLLFSEARKRAPCVVFLDEADALATKPTGPDGADSRKQQILNRLLVEIDGFDPLEGVMVIAATHRPDEIDPALTRSGRLGKSIVFRYPSEIPRKAIWMRYLSKLTLSQTPDLTALSRASAGFSAADIAEAANSGALRAGSSDRESVTMDDLLKACDELFWGEDPSHEPEAVLQQHWTSTHEAGHALVAAIFGRRVERATVRPRSGFLGAVHELPEEEGHPPVGPKELFERACVYMGGIAAEEVCFGHRSTGGRNDLARATEMTRNSLVSCALGSQAFKNATWLPNSPLSETRLTCLENEEESILTHAFEATKNWLILNQTALENFSATLLESRELSGSAIGAWLNEHPLVGAPSYFWPEPTPK